MKFMDVVQRGIIQAYDMKLDGRMTRDRFQRLLKYKGERVSRLIIRGLNEGAQPQIIWD